MYNIVIVQKQQGFSSLTAIGLHKVHSSLLPWFILYCNCTVSVLLVYSNCTTSGLPHNMFTTGYDRKEPVPIPSTSTDTSIDATHS